MKTTILILSTFALLFTSCGTRRNVGQDATFDEGVVINGVRWATRNVAGYGRFTRNPHEAGGRFNYIQAQNACPPGWRLPTYEELQSLANADSEWMRKNGVRGRFFGTAPNRLFLPAVGMVSDRGVESSWNTGVYLGSTQRADDENAWVLNFGNTHTIVFLGGRISRYSVRCVADID